MAKFYSTKTYGNDRGLSCCFRQWRASHSHCSTLHGYSIGIKLVFECDTLDDKNWCMDFGGLKEFKAWADYMFDHTLVVAEDDPMLAFFKEMNSIVNMGSPNPESTVPYERGALCDLRIVPGVGCEMFAKLCYDKMAELLASGDMRYPINPTVKIKSVEVFEHGANSATYEG
ncbi:MAG: 6-pyruvoyl tetrahydrobiopterin synthase [Gammaproteobacteria bacterium]|nr:6-pyruvoyl tetrahydrobiopterin synthase [Gammaproteobacteria bacterium]